MYLYSQQQQRVHLSISSAERLSGDASVATICPQEGNRRIRPSRQRTDLQYCAGVLLPAPAQSPRPATMGHEPARPRAVSTAVEILYCSCVNQRRCPQRELRLSMHAMRAVSIIAVLLLLVANALELLPVASPFEPYLSGGALVLGLVALVTILAGRGPERDTRAAAEAARPMPVPTRRKLPGRCRDRQLSSDAAGKGPAGRFPDGRHQHV